MATQHFFGDAELEYDGGVYTVVHELAAPLTTNAPAGGFQSTARRRRWTAWSADFRERTVFVMESGADEIVATIRYDNEPAALRALLRAGLDGAAMIYRPYGPEGIEIPCLLIAIEGAGPDEETIKPDRDRWSLGEWEVTIVLRAVDGGNFEAIL